METRATQVMREDGWYYLHTNGDLIFKATWPGEDGSDFVKKIWPVDTSRRENGWTIILEGLALDADFSRVQGLAERWGCNVKDFVEFLVRAKPSELSKRGAHLFLERVVGVDPNSFWEWLDQTPEGERPDFSTMPTPHSSSPPSGAIPAPT